MTDTQTRTEQLVADIYAADAWLAACDPNRADGEPYGPLWHRLTAAMDNADLSADEWDRRISDYEVHIHDAAWVSCVHGGYNDGAPETCMDETIHTPVTIAEAARLQRELEAGRARLDDAI